MAKPTKETDGRRRLNTKHRKHLRARIASGVKLSISASESSRRVGVFIVSRGSDPASKLLKRRWDQEGLGATRYGRRRARKTSG